MHAFVRGLAILTCSAFVAGGCASLDGSGGAVDASALTPSEALDELMRGNERYVQGHPKYPAQSEARRAEVAEGQAPFAVIVGCADSRVPPEVIFDRGLGELFVIRTAGHLVDDVAMGSIEYGVVAAGAKVVVVLGHERCGAVDAAIGVVEGAETPPGSIDALTDRITPVVQRTSRGEGDYLDTVIVANVRNTVEQLRESPLLGPLVASGDLLIVCARKDLDDGEVRVVYR